MRGQRRTVHPGLGVRQSPRGPSARTGRRSRLETEAHRPRAGLADGRPSQGEGEDDGSKDPGRFQYGFTHSSVLRLDSDLGRSPLPRARSLKLLFYGHGKSKPTQEISSADSIQKAPKLGLPKSHTKKREKYEDAKGKFKNENEKPKWCSRVIRGSSIYMAQH